MHLCEQLEGFDEKLHLVYVQIMLICRSSEGGGIVLHQGIYRWVFVTKETEAAHYLEVVVL